MLDQAEIKSASSKDDSVSNAMLSDSMQGVAAPNLIKHETTPAEKQAIESGSDVLTKMLVLKGFINELDPPKPNYRTNISAETRVKIDDGSGDFMRMTANMGPASIEKDVDGSAISPKEFSKQVIASAAETNFDGLGHSPTMVQRVPDLDMPPLWGKDGQELKNSYCGVNAIRENIHGQTPPGEAMAVTVALGYLTKTNSSEKPREAVLEDLHKVAERISKDSAPFQQEFKEAIENWNALKMIPPTKILPGGIIQTAITDASGTTTAVVTAYPDKPTEYIELKAQY